MLIIKSFVKVRKMVNFTIEQSEIAQRSHQTNKHTHAIHAIHATPTHIRHTLIVMTHLQRDFGPDDSLEHKSSLRVPRIYSAQQQIAKESKVGVRVEGTLDGLCRSSSSRQTDDTVGQMTRARRAVDESHRSRGRNLLLFRSWAKRNQERLHGHGGQVCLSGSVRRGIQDVKKGSGAKVVEQVIAADLVFSDGIKLCDALVHQQSSVAFGHSDSEAVILFASCSSEGHDDVAFIQNEPPILNGKAFRVKDGVAFEVNLAAIEVAHSAPILVPMPVPCPQLLLPVI